MKVIFTLSIGFPTAKQKDVMDFPEDATDEEIEEDYKIWQSNFIDGGWKRI